jgi:hypothetical protein
LVAEAAIALDREVEKRHLKPPASPLLTSDPTLFAIVVRWRFFRSSSCFCILDEAARLSSSSCCLRNCVFDLELAEIEGHFWFWATIGCFVLLHAVLILLFPWRTGWVPAAILTPLCIVDLGIMFGIIGFLEKRNNKELDRKSSDRWKKFGALSE